MILEVFFANAVLIYRGFILAIFIEILQRSELKLILFLFNLARSLNEWCAKFNWTGEG